MVNDSNEYRVLLSIQFWVNGDVSLMELYEIEWLSPTISTIHDTNSIQDAVYAMINFGIRNGGKISTKLRSTKWRFDEVTIRRKL